MSERPSMDTYEVKLGSRRGNPGRKIIAALCCAALFFILRFGWIILFPTSSERNTRLMILAIETGTTGLLYGLALVFKPFAPLRSYKVLVDDESITGLTTYDGWMRWFRIRHTVRKGRVRTIFEIQATAFSPGGLALSERSRLGARFWGCVFLPRELAEYDDLRRVVESWRRSATSY